MGRSKHLNPDGVGAQWHAVHREGRRALVEMLKCCTFYKIWELDEKEMASAVDGTAQLLGSFRIWTAIIVGSIVMLLAAAAFAYSFSMAKFASIDAKVVSVHCAAAV